MVQFFAFVLQCAFGCRICEFKRLTMDNIDVSDDGIMFVHYLPEKTLRENLGREEIRTPVMRFAYDIIMKYRFNFHILKYVSGKSGYNVKIKELMKHCGIDRNVQFSMKNLVTINTFPYMYWQAARPAVGPMWIF